MNTSGMHSGNNTSLIDQHLELVKLRNSGGTLGAPEIVVEDGNRLGTQVENLDEKMLPADVKKSDSDNSDN